MQADGGIFQEIRKILLAKPQAPDFRFEVRDPTVDCSVVPLWLIQVRLPFPMLVDKLHPGPSIIGLASGDKAACADVYAKLVLSDRKLRLHLDLKILYQFRGR